MCVTAPGYRSTARGKAYARNMCLQHTHASVLGLCGPPLNAPATGPGRAPLCHQLCIRVGATAEAAEAAASVAASESIVSEAVAVADGEVRRRSLRLLAERIPAKVMRHRKLKCSGG